MALVIHQELRQRDPSNPVKQARAAVDDRIIDDGAIDGRVQKTAQRYLALCSEFQRLSATGYVPEEFYQRFIQFTADEAEVVSDVAYTYLTQDQNVQDHLARSSRYEHLQVSGKGNNCGLYSLATEIVTRGDEESLDEVRRQVTQLRGESDDRAIVLAGLARPGRHLLGDQRFLDAFARILRVIGEQLAPGYLKEMGASEDEIAEFVPKRGEMAPAEFLLSLAARLKMKGVAVWAIGRSGRVLQKSGCEGAPNLIIKHTGNHYTPSIAR